MNTLSFLKVAEQNSNEKRKKKEKYNKLHRILTKEETKQPEYVTNNFVVPVDELEEENESASKLQVLRRSELAD